MTNLLHVISTPRGFASNTGRVSNALLEDLCEQDDGLVVTTLDLFKADLPSVAGKNIESKYMLMTGQALDDAAQASWRQIERTIEQFLEAAAADVEARFGTPEGPDADELYSEPARDLMDTIEGWLDDLPGAFNELLVFAEAC